MESLNSKQPTMTMMCGVMDILWLLTFFGVWSLLLFFWDTILLGIVLLLVFTVMLQGLSEFMHQGAHGNLFWRSKANDIFGTGAGYLISVDFKGYRSFHNKHHRTMGTEGDTERAIYSSGYASEFGSWNTLSTLGKLLAVLKVSWTFAGALLGKVGSSSRFVLCIQWGFLTTISFLVAFFVRDLTWYMSIIQALITWPLPLFLVIIPDLFLSQSRHYGKPQIESEAGRVDHETQRQHSWNIILPWGMAFLVMNRNLHAEHHYAPGRHWSLMRPEKKSRSSIPLKRYLVWWWYVGPRTVE